MYKVLCNVKQSYAWKRVAEMLL